MPRALAGLAVWIQSACDQDFWSSFLPLLEIPASPPGHCRQWDRADTIRSWGRQLLALYPLQPAHTLSNIYANLRGQVSRKSSCSFFGRSPATSVTTFCLNRIEITAQPRHRSTRPEPFSENEALHDLRGTLRDPSWSSATGLLSSMLWCFCPGGGGVLICAFCWQLCLSLEAWKIVFGEEACARAHVGLRAVLREAVPNTLSYPLLCRASQFDSASLLTEISHWYLQPHFCSG